MSPDLRVGLALGGGFARAIAHVGVLQALAENGVPVHLVAGTSAGSLVGALFCAGLDPWLLERAAENMNWRGLVRLKLRRDGLLDNSGLERFILGNVGDLEFADMSTPLAVVACDLLTGEEVILQSGKVSAAVRASCAFPGIFLPVRHGDRVLVDGGLVNNVPGSVCRQMGADLVIAVELNRQRKATRHPRNLVHIILHSLSVVQRPQIESCLSHADVRIQPDLNDFSLLELERVREMVRIGKEAALQVMPQIKAALARLTDQRHREERPV